MLRSMMGIYREFGWLPRWELYGRETRTMEGDPALPVIVDSYFKGLCPYDAEEVYQAMRKHAFTSGKDNPLRPATVTPHGPSQTRKFGRKIPIV